MNWISLLFRDISLSMRENQYLISITSINKTDSSFDHDFSKWYHNCVRNRDNDIRSMEIDEGENWLIRMKEKQKKKKKKKEKIEERNENCRGDWAKLNCRRVVIHVSNKLIFLQRKCAIADYQPTNLHSYHIVCCIDLLYFLPSFNTTNEINSSQKKI